MAFLALKGCNKTQFLAGLDKPKKPFGLDCANRGFALIKTKKNDKNFVFNF